MVVLRVISGLNPGQEFPLEGDSAILGRHPSCDIVLEEGAVSRQHARVFHEAGMYYVEDLGSRNGTYVNGERIYGQHPLHHNDEVQICEMVFGFDALGDSNAGTTYGEAVQQREGRRSTTREGFAVADSPWPMMVDAGEGLACAPVMSKVDVVCCNEGVRLAVNPEVKLRALLEITNNLAKSLELDAVLPKILESLFKVFIQADRGFILLADGRGPLVPKAVKYRRAGEDDTIRISKTIVNEVMSTRQAVLSADAASDSRFAMSESIADFRIRSFMCAPLISSDGEAMGLIQIDTHDHRSRFQEDDLEVLASVAAQAAFAVENAKLHEQALARQALERDLALAHRVQQGFLPKESPQIPGYQFFDYYVPANQVGGDMYDYVQLPDNRLAVIVADVAGKGVSAALLMAKVSSDARYWLAGERCPAVAMTRLSEAFIKAGWSDRFVTMLLAVIDFKTHEVILVNAGHMPPILRHADGTVEEVGDEAAGVPIGVEEDWEYEEFHLRLEPGDSLTCFTDGFSEASNGLAELYGVERLHKQVALPAAGVKELGEHILADVQSFVGNYKQSDDMCLLCFGRDTQ